jgi:threonine dehydratase
MVRMTLVSWSPSLRLEAASAFVHSMMTPTAHRWPLLGQRAAEVGEAREPHAHRRVQDPWLSITGGFSAPNRVVLASSPRRGNHGQSLALLHRAPALTLIVVSSREQRPRERCDAYYGAELIEHGRDYQEAADPLRGSRASGSFTSPPFHELLVAGVAYALELFRAVAEIDTVLCPSAWAPASAASWRSHAPGLRRSSAPRGRSRLCDVVRGRDDDTAAADTMADGLPAGSPMRARSRRS